jgi:hypothetical protein
VLSASSHRKCSALLAGGNPKQMVRAMTWPIMPVVTITH